MTSIRNKIVSVGMALAVLTMTSGLPEALAAQQTNHIRLIPRITSVTLVSGQLVATGVASATINGKTYQVPFSSPIDVTTAPNQQDPTCPVLDLRLGPINLNLLGLIVQTSPICLTITAHSGGGLLGDLLCGLANALNGGTPLATALGNLTADQLSTVLSGLTTVLNGAVSQLRNAVLNSIQQVGAHHTCAILHLSLGPVDLTLLGLQVVLDNCAGGPVTVDITAMTGQGNLLGNLLCGLLHGGLINLGATLQQILNQILALLNQ